MASNTVAGDATCHVVTWYVSLHISFCSAYIGWKSVHIILQKGVSNCQVSFLNIAPDAFDVLDAVYDLMLEAGPVDIRVKQSHIELFQFEG